MTNKSGARLGAGKSQRRQKINAATDTLALLDQQATVVRAELAGLQQNLADVQLRLVAARASELRGANEQLVIAATHAESIAAEAVSNIRQAARASQPDPLADTPNRALILDRLKSAIALAQRHRTHIAVLFLDLDELKQINAALGRAIGDVVVQLVLRRLGSVVRRSDTVSRHGGDERLVLMAEINDPADAALIAEKMLTVLAAPNRVADHLVSLSASIGIALYPADGDDAATLISRADAAMNRCREQGGGNFQFYRASLRPGPASPQWASRCEVLPDERSSAMDNLREANQQLVMAILTAQELEEQIQMKHARQVKFMAMVAHELRNPLTPIRTAAGLLKRVHTTDLMGDVQVLIEEQVVRMSRLVEDLLDSTRVGAGKFRVEWSKVQLPSILERAVATCRPELAARNQRLTLRMPSGAPDILGDPMRLTQIFSNLLDNASKYTQEGGEIAVTVEPSDDTVRVRVSDNGIGISPEALTSIFDLFVQDERAVTICRGGLGIGLAVVRDLVGAHGGTITAHSSGENLGSEFVVTLPIRGPGERRRGEQGNRSP
jgi:diguanylate cyclase (GGDEF)-like protein